MYKRIPSIRYKTLIILILILISVVYPIHKSAGRGNSMEPARISIISGNNQSGGVGLPLPRQFVVEVLAAYKRELPNAAVTFTVLAGGGTLPNGSSVITVNTNFFGKAGTTLTLGGIGETNRVEARVGDLNPVIFTATVVNSAPEISPIGNKQVNENAQLNFTVSATDPDPGDSVTLSTSALPGNSNFNPATGIFTFSPDYTQSAVYLVTFFASDGVTISSETIAITVVNINRPPILTPIGPQTVNENSEITIAIMATDPDGDAFSISASGMPPGAVLQQQNAPQSIFTWTPGFGTVTSGNSLNFFVTFTVEDILGGSDSEQVTIEVIDVDPPPEPDISTAPPIVDFGTVTVDKSADRVFLIHNNGGAPLEIGRVIPTDPQYAILAYSQIDGKFVVLRYSEVDDQFVVAEYLEVNNPLSVTAYSQVDDKPVTVTYSGVGGQFVITEHPEAVGAFPLATYSTIDPQFVNIAYPVLPPGASLILIARFTPASVGEKTGQLFVISNDPHKPVVPIDVQGEGIEVPNIRVSPTSVDSGEVELGQSSNRVLNIHNDGNAPLHISNIISTDPQFTISGYSDVPPAGQIAITITFTPSSLGEKTATLSIISDDPDKPVLHVSLEGTGINVIKPDIRVSPTSIDSGEVELDQSSHRVLNIHNDGNAPLHISNIISTNLQFTISGYSDVPPAGQIAITITFTPSSLGEKTATLNIISDDPDKPVLYVSLEGKGIAVIEPDIRVSPTSIDSGEVELGQSSNRVLNIHNDGNAPLHISNIIWNNPQFTISGYSNVAPASQIAITITFTPSSLGNKTATLSIISDDPDKPVLYVSLEGKGIEVLKASMRVSPHDISFGDVEKEQSSQMSLMVHNDGNTVLQIHGIISNNPQFTVSGFSNVNPAAQITVTATFTPSSTGQKTGTISVVGSDPDNPVIEVSVEGTGIQALEPDIRFWPTSLSFGNVEVGESPVEMFWIHNDGDVLLDVSSITSNNSQFVPQIVPDVPPGSLAAVPVRFTPTSSGGKFGNLTIASNDPNEPSKIFPVSGNGIITPEPDIRVVPLSLGFNEVEVGDFLDKIIQIHNDGDATLQISSIISNNDDFEVLSHANVPPGGMIQVTVRFTPESVGTKFGLITIASDDPNDPSVLVPVAGEGIHIPEPDIYAAPLSVNFGEIEPGESADGSFFIYNFGDLLLQIFSITSNNGEFQVLNPLSDMPPNSVVELWLRFSPSSPGTKTGSITIKSNDPDEPTVIISLSGSGAEPEFLMVGDWQNSRQLNILNDLYDVNFVNNDKGWVVGSNGAVAYSGNGGNTWTLQSSNTTSPLHGVWFTNTSVGWAVGRYGTILRTVNSGQSWSAWNSGVSADLNAVHFVSSSRGWIVGQAGTVLTTTNGYNWISRNSQTQFALNDVYFVDSYRGWAVGNYGTILRSTNGGQTWTPQNSGTTHALYGVDFVNTYEGWAVGSNGTILHTHNGGQTWTRQSNSVSYAVLSGMDFINSSEGWIVGQSGIMLYTDNGGSTWSRIENVVNDNLRAVQFRDVDNGWAVGNYGAILKHHETQPPEITSVQIIGSPATTGDVISVIAIGQPGNQATFSITGAISYVPMIENPPGTYTGSYAIVEGMNLDRASVIVTLRNSRGDTATDMSQSVIVDTVATIHWASVTPTTAKTGDIVTVTMRGEADGAARFSIGNIVMNAIMTEASGTPGSYTGQYTVPQGMNMVDLEVTVELTDSLGNVDTESAGQLTIDTRAHITTASVGGSPAKFGDPISVKLIGEAGGSVKFSIAGLVSVVTMPETQPGIYNGSYTASKGTHAKDADVNVQLTDALGNVATRFVGRVTIDTESRIDSVTMSGSPAKAGEVIGVALIGEPGGTARFSIAGVVDGIVMTENQSGVYTGIYPVSNGTNVTNAVLTASLTDPVGNIATDASQSITIDTKPPEINSVNVTGSPAKVGDDIIITAVGDSGASAKFSIASLIEDVPMTEAPAGVYTGTYTVSGGTNVIDATITVELSDQVGNVSANTSRSVTIDTATAEIDQVSVSGSPAKAGETITVTAIGESGATAKFSIAGVMGSVSMTEVQPGVYRGSYLVPDGINAVDAVLTVTLTDSLGNVGTDTSQSVTIDSKAPEITSVSVSGSPARVGETISIIAVGEPGASAKFSIAGVTDNVLMTEIQPGVYTGTYVVQDGINVTNATVTVILKDSLGNVGSDSSQSATIDTKTPEITSVNVSGSPAKAGEIVRITVISELDASIRFSIANVVDDVLMTEVQPGAYTGAYVVANGVGATDAVVTIILTDSVGNVSVDTSQRVNIDTTNPAITSVSVSGSPAKPGETIGVTMVGEPDGKAQFSIANIVEDIPMEEDAGNPGVYNGTYTVIEDGINITDAVVTVTLEDGVGNIGSDTSGKVTIRPSWDVNRDGAIDSADLAAITVYFGQAVDEGNDADVNGDGKVDILDIIIVSSNFDEDSNAAPGKRSAAIDPEQLLMLRKLYDSIDGSGDDIRMVKKLLAGLIGLPDAQITRSRLMQNYPNPFNPETWIPYELGQAGSVIISIYTPAGQLVRTLDLGHRDVGSYSHRSGAAYWDGMNEYGETAASGIYFYAIKSGSFRAIKKMIVRR